MGRQSPELWPRSTFDRSPVRASRTPGSVGEVSGNRHLYPTLFSLVTLWAANLAARTGELAVLGAAWYRKSDPTFADCLAAVRRVLWAEEAASPILWRDDYPSWRARARDTENPRPLHQRLAELMSYAA